MGKLERPGHQIRREGKRVQMALAVRRLGPDRKGGATARCLRDCMLERDRARLEACNATGDHRMEPAPAMARDARWPVCPRRKSRPQSVRDSGRLRRFPMTRSRTLTVRFLVNGI